jgi:hypothetical protein
MALLIGVVIGATERTVIVNRLDTVASELHARIAKLEEAVKGKP